MSINWPKTTQSAVYIALVMVSQAHAANDRILEEIIVSAQKISESVQNVPISVAVVTAENLREVNAFEFVETVQLTPGVDVSPGMQGAAIRIRGVGPGFFAVAGPQSVAVYVDQAAQAQVGAVFATLVDIERFELLRGPQGTLYGQNAPGGVYNITTRSPDQDGVGGYLEGSYSQFDSSDMATGDFRGAINVPLMEDKLALRVAGVYAESDGYVRMKNPVSSEDVTGGKEHEAIRAKLLWDVADDMSFLLTSNYQDLTDYEAGFNYDGQLPDTGDGAPLPPIYNKFEDNRNWGEERSEVTGSIEDVSLVWRWDTAGPSVETILFHQEFETNSDIHREAYPGKKETFKLGFEYLVDTVELRFSDSGELLDYVAGAYYYNKDATGLSDIEISGVVVSGITRAEDTGYAAFGNFNFHVAQAWDLTLGLRYDDSSSDTIGNTSFLAYEAAIDDGLDFNEFSWSIKLRHYINDILTAYVALDRAYKQGGFNPLPTAALSLEDIFPLQAALAEEVFMFEPEESTALEFGLKGTALDSQLRFGVAIYYQQFKDHQVQQPEDVVALRPLHQLFTAVLSNAEEVTSAGVEFDASYLFGDYWDAGLRLAYSAPKIEEWSERFCAPGQESSPDQLYCPGGGGEPLNSLPRWSTNVQLGYSRPLAIGWDVYGRAGWNWNSEPAKTTATDHYADPKNSIGLTLGARKSDLGLDLRAWVKNLTDEDFNVDPIEGPNFDSAGMPLSYRGDFYRGREYGITVHYDF